MKLAKENRHKRDRYTREHPDYANNHIYLIRGQSHIEKGYKSATTWLKQFFDDFDADAIIDQYYDNWQKRKHEKYYGKSKDEIKQMWDDNRDEAATAGTHMHLQFELFANGAKYEWIQEFDEFINWWTTEGIKPWRTEMTIYSPKYRIVGNVDLIAYDKNGDMIIVDYKRSEPKMANFGRYCKGPLSEYPHNDMTKHALQLSVYKKILEDLYDVEIKGLYNLYIKEDGKYWFKKQEYIDKIDELVEWARDTK